MRLTYILLFAFWIFGCISKGKGQNDKRVDELIKLAEVSDSLRDIKHSIQYYNQILEIDSTKLVALINRGRALIWNGQVKEGFTDFDNAVRLYPHEHTFYTRGLAYVKMKSYDKASQDFQHSLKLNPRFGAAYWGFSLIKEAEGKLDSALMYCNKAEEYACPLEQVQTCRAELYERKRDFTSAILEMTKLIQHDPSNATYYNNRGYERNQMHQYAQAIEDLGTAIKLDSSMAFAYSNKAFALLKENQLSAALQQVNISLRLNDRNAYAFKTRGEVFLALQEKGKACSDFSTAERLNNDGKFESEIRILKEKACSH